MEDGPHRELLDQAIAAEAPAQRALLTGDAEVAAEGFARAAALYRDSWAAAPPRSFGRLVGMAKATVLGGGDVDAAAAYVREAVPVPDSPPSWYAVAIAALVQDDDETAAAAADGMDAGSPAFQRAAAAVRALAAHDAEGFAGAVRAIVEDFEGRDDHLTGVPIADTAAMLERLAERRGMGAGAASALLPHA
jgi:hypothetical protein